MCSFCPPALPRLGFQTPIRLGGECCCPRGAVWVHREATWSDRRNLTGCSPLSQRIWTVRFPSPSPAALWAVQFEAEGPPVSYLPGEGGCGPPACACRVQFPTLPVSVDFAVRSASGLVLARISAVSCPSSLIRIIPSGTPLLVLRSSEFTASFAGFSRVLSEVWVQIFGKNSSLVLVPRILRPVFYRRGRV